VSRFTVSIPRFRQTRASVWSTLVSTLEQRTIRRVAAPYTRTRPHGGVGAPGRHQQVPRMALDFRVTRAGVGAGTLVTARGVVDVRTIWRFEVALLQLAGPDEALTVDLTDVEVPSAAGRALLLNAVRRLHTAHPRLRVVCPPGSFRTALERSALARRLDMADRLPADPAPNPVTSGAAPGVRLASGPVQRKATPARRGALLAEATVAIEAWYADPDLSLHQVARRIATSSRQLQRVLAELAGSSFRAELQAVRMQHAAELLQTSHLPISEIAHRVGHRQPAQFSKAFRRHHGVSPSAMRRAARAERTPARPG
jgi:AraC family transcriptional regulator of adaptative response / methylphosphotriester-DNA alkyltransferase methyltransferase